LNDRQCGIKKDVAAPGADKSQKKTSACGTKLLFDQLVGASAVK
jgi:hypothetical protein